MDDAVGAAAQAFGLEVAAWEQVSVSENITVRLDASNGSSYVLRFHRPGYHTLAELESERHWLQALRDAGLSTPMPLPASDGERHYVPVEMPEGPPRFAGLSSWIEGDIIDSLFTGHVQPVAEHMGQLGHLMATMHEQATAWIAPPGFVRHRLDADGLLGEAPFWGRFWEHPDLTSDQRDLIVEARDTFRAVLDDVGEPADRFSMIHADLHLSNLLIAPDGRVTVIDFDDAGMGWHHYDIAVAWFHSRDAADFDAGQQAFLDSYRATRPLSDADLRLIDMFEIIRGMALLGWKHARPELKWADGILEGLVAQTLDAYARWKTD